MKSKLELAEHEQFIKNCGLTAKDFARPDPGLPDFYTSQRINVQRGYPLPLLQSGDTLHSGHKALLEVLNS